MRFDIEVVSECPLHCVKCDIASTVIVPPIAWSLLLLLKQMVASSCAPRIKKILLWIVKLRTLI